MATVLFINRTDLVRNSIMDGNISTDKFIQFIKLSQEIDVQQILGTNMYDGLTTAIPNIDLPVNARWKLILDDFVVPMLIWYAQANYYPFAAYQVRQGGVYKHTSESAESVSKSEIDFLVEKARTNAEWYSRRFIDFMGFNQTTYPEYTNNVNDDIYPSGSATFNGWVL
jgi:hypothetical protein|tara:strand:+ start:1863 stop:2369 length:507 start_codon:yes stop_codon:yes gene_type:complete